MAEKNHERRLPTVRCLFLLATVIITAAPNIKPDTSLATLTVTKLADTNDGSCDTDCSMREALAVATSDNTIVFAAGLRGTVNLSSTLIISKNVTISGPSAESIIISGNNAVRVFYVGPGVHLTIRYLTVANGCIKGLSRPIGVHGRSDGAGGKAEGGGLFNNGGIVSIINTTFSANRAMGGSGGVATGHGGGAGGDGMGGALFSSGSVFLVNSTFSSNSAKGGGGGNWYQDMRSVKPPSNNSGPGGNGYGGAIFSLGEIWVSSCTFAGNSASGAAGGFGLATGAAGVGSGGAIYRPGAVSGKRTLAVNRSGVIHITNTLIAGSSSGGNCEALIISGGYNIDTDGTCGLKAVGDLSETNPKLGRLKSNGGTTLTHALLPGSPAIDAGNPAGCADHTGAAIATDQRGRSRNGKCDVGAFEFSP